MGSAAENEHSQPNYMEQKTPKFSNDVDTDCVDRISNLPLEIIHEILKLLPLKDEAKISVLSRRWKTILASRPDILLDEREFGVGYSSAVAKREAFRTYLEKFLDTRDHNFAVNCFYLRMTLVENPSSELLLKRISDFLSKCKVKVLFLHIRRHGSQGFDLPIIAPFADSLTIQHCKFISSCSFVLPNLRTLHLSYVCIEDDAFEGLIAACPRIESLHILLCSKLSTIVVSHPTLKCLGIHIEGFDGKIQIESTNLEDLSLTGLREDKCEVQITATTSVKSLTLKRVYWQEKTLMHFISKFPLLEELVIHRWSYDYKIVEIRIDAPKLKSLEYIGGLTSFPGIKASHELESVIFHLKTQRRDAGWYIWLKDSLESFAHSKHLSLICQNEQDIIFPDELTEILRPTINDLKNLDLRIHSKNATYQQILDGFIWIFPCLKTLKLTLGSISKLIELPQRE